MGLNSRGSPVNVPVLQSDFDETFRLIAADLTPDGNQYSRIITAPVGGLSDDYVTLYEATLTPKVTGTFFWAYFLIVVNLQQTGACGGIHWKAQARNENGIWADLADWQTVEVDTSSAEDYRLEGEISWSGSTAYENVTDDTILTELTRVPMNFRVIFFTDHPNRTADGRLKNSSQIRLVGKMD